MYACALGHNGSPLGPNATMAARRGSQACSVSPKEAYHGGVPGDTPAQSSIPQPNASSLCSCYIIHCCVIQCMLSYNHSALEYRRERALTFERLGMRKNYDFGPVHRSSPVQSSPAIVYRLHSPVSNVSSK